MLLFAGVCLREEGRTPDRAHGDQQRSPQRIQAFLCVEDWDILGRVHAPKEPDVEASGAFTAFIALAYLSFIVFCCFFHAR